MDRQKAINIACRCAEEKPQRYYNKHFQPHEWVVDAIMEATREAKLAGIRIGLAGATAYLQNPEMFREYSSDHLKELAAGVTAIDPASLMEKE